MVAAFDFDGTISRRDTLLPFLQRLCGANRLYRALAAQGAAFGRMALGRADRDAVKDAFLFRLLAGRVEDEVAEAGRTYAAFLAGEDRLRPESLAQVDEHRRRGHEVVLVSASPEVYLGPLGQRLGLDGVLATGLEVGPDGRLSGRMDGGNCRGPEKVARLEGWLGGAEPFLYAYGDSAGDRELLARADVGTLVKPRRPFPPLDGRAAGPTAGGGGTGPS